MNWTGQQKGEGFEFHLLALSIAAVLMVRGSGAFSVDRALGGQSESTAARRKNKQEEDEPVKECKVHGL